MCVPKTESTVTRTIVTNGGIEALARAMINHADNRAVQVTAAHAVSNLVVKMPASNMAAVKRAGLVPLLERAVRMGVSKGESGDPAKLLKLMVA